MNEDTFDIDIIATKINKKPQREILDLDLTDVILKLEMLIEESKNRKIKGIWIPISFAEEIMNNLSKG